jgi:hypothetical protein
LTFCKKRPRVHRHFHFDPFLLQLNRVDSVASPDHVPPLSSLSPRLPGCLSTACPGLVAYHRLMAGPAVICDTRLTEDCASAPARLLMGARDLICDAALPSDIASGPICAATDNAAASPPCAAIASDALTGAAHMKAISVSNSKTCLLAFKISSCLLANCRK